MSKIACEDFERADIRAGRATRAGPCPEARKPALKLWIDVGPGLREKGGSARITEPCAPEALAGRTLLAAMNVPPRQIGPVRSEVLGLSHAEGRVVLVGPDRDVPAGARPH